MLDEKSRQNIEEMEKISGKPTGIGRIQRGECPLGANTPMGCMFCAYGHMLDCHHPKTCKEANCSHHQQAIAEEGEW